MIGNVWDDSILYAGVASCPECGRVAYPSDARWLDGALIVAFFPAPCAHCPARIMVIDPEKLPATSGDLSRCLPGRRCAGHVRSGRPCRAYAEVGSDFCSAHGPVREASPDAVALDEAFRAAMDSPEINREEPYDGDDEGTPI